MTNIVTESKLKSLLYLSRKRGEKIVMTNGVFDILHVGHISYLSHAKKLGDKLIVAVNSDSSAQRLKGKNRPVNSLAHRMIMLSALKTVDWVIPFYEDTPYRLIVNILPHYLVKGGDYKINEIIGSKEVIENGGYIKILPFKSNCSTTRIINTIKRNL